MKKKLELYMPVEGQVLPISEVNAYLYDDTVGGMGAAIIPEGDIFYAPVSGNIVLVSDNLNSVAIRTKEEVTILLHAGIDTAKFQGRGFGAYVKEGDKVSVGDKLLYMDRDFVELRAKIASPLIITTPEKVKHIEVQYKVTEAFVKFMELTLG